MALGSFLNDYFRGLVPHMPSEQDAQALMASLFTGTPQDQVNITPRVTAPPDPSSQALMNPTAQQVPTQPLMPNVQPMGAGNPQLAQRAAAGAYNGPAAPLMQGPQADQLKALLGNLSPQTAMPFLASLLQNQITPKPPIVTHEGDTLISPTTLKPLYTAPPKGLTPNEKVAQTENDYKSLDSGSDAIAKAMAPSDPSLGFRAPGLSWEQRKGVQTDEQLKKDQESPDAKVALAGREAQARADVANAPIKTSENDRAANAARVAAGEPMTQIFPGYRGNVMAQREQARSDAIDKILSENPGMSAGDAGTELANRTIAFQSGKKSSGQLTQMLGATKQAVGQLDFNIKKTKEEMGKLGSSDLSPIINAIARGEEKWTGNPAYSSLFYYMHATAVESARILSGGQSSAAQLHQGAMEEANKWANVNMTPASFDAVADAMTAEGANRVQTYNDALRSQRVGGPGAQAKPDAATHPSNIPPGSLYSPSRQQYKTPDGRILDKSGAPVK